MRIVVISGHQYRDSVWMQCTLLHYSRSKRPVCRFNPPRPGPQPHASEARKESSSGCRRNQFELEVVSAGGHPHAVREPSERGRVGQRTGSKCWLCCIDCAACSDADGCRFGGSATCAVPGTRLDAKWPCCGQRSGRDGQRRRGAGASGTGRERGEAGLPPTRSRNIVVSQLIKIIPS